MQVEFTMLADKNHTAVDEARRLTGEVREAVARRLAGLAGQVSTQSQVDTTKMLSSAMTLEILPTKDGSGSFQIAGTHGMATTLSEQMSITRKPSPEDLAAILLKRFPPRKVAAADLSRDNETIAGLGLYDTPEIGLAFFVLWTEKDVRFFLTAEDIIRAVFVPEEDVPHLAGKVRSLTSGQDLSIHLPTEKHTVGVVP